MSTTMPEETTTNPAPKKIGLNDELTQHDALGILIQGIRFAQSKGVFSIEDAALLGKAVAVFVKKEDVPAPEEPTKEGAE